MQKTPEPGASRSIVPPQMELLRPGTPLAFVEGITSTIHTRPTDSRSMRIVTLHFCLNHRTHSFDGSANKN